MATIQTVLEAANAFCQNERDRASTQRSEMLAERWHRCAQAIAEVQGELEAIAEDYGPGPFYRDVDVDKYDADALIRAIMKHVPAERRTRLEDIGNSLGAITQRFVASLTDREREVLAMRFGERPSTARMACGCAVGAHPDVANDPDVVMSLPGHVCPAGWPTKPQ